MPNSIELPSVHDAHCNSYVSTSNSDYSDTEAGSQDACIQPELAPVWRSISATEHLDNYWAGKPISNDYCDIFELDMNP